MPAPDLYISEVARDNKHGQWLKIDKQDRRGDAVEIAKSPFIIFQQAIIIGDERKCKLVVALAFSCSLGKTETRNHTQNMPWLQSTPKDF